MNANVPVQIDSLLLDAPPKPIDIDKTERLGRMPGLDGLRGIAVVLVMLVHFVENIVKTNEFEKVLGYVVGQGTMAVDLFFLMSGFLITGILFDSRHKPGYFRNFYTKRAFRILPLYYAVLFVMFFVVPSIPGVHSSSLEEILPTQAWLWLPGANVYHAIQGKFALSYVNYFWTLSIEQHFYLVWPVLVWALRERSRALMWTSLGVALMSRVGALAATAISDNAFMTMLTPFHLHGIALGSFLAVLLRQRGGKEVVRRWLPRAALAVAGILVASFAWHRVTELGHSILKHVRPSMFLIFLACLLMSAALAPPTSRLTRFLTNRAFLFLAPLSYGLYVFHHFFSFYFMKHETEFAVTEWVGSHTVAVLLQATFGIGISIAAAYASYHLFEKRILALKSSLQTRRT